MLYHFLRPLARMAFAGFFRRVHVSGLEHIPRGVPLILAVNHPTAFIEPCFLACHAGRDLYFMTRGDVFARPWARRVLSWLHLIPIYRSHDGFANVRRNAGSFSAALEVLRRNKAVLIMAEGGLRHEQRLRPLRKGAARMAFDALEQCGLQDVHIQAIAVNYTRAESARGEMMVRVFPPLAVRDFQAHYQQHPRRALEALTDALARDLREGVIHIADSGDDAMVPVMLALDAAKTPRPWGWRQVVSDAFRLRQKQLVDHLNALPEALRIHLRASTAQLVRELSAGGLSPEALYPHRRPGMLRIALNTLLLGLLFPLHGVPLAIARSLTRRKVYVLEFRSSVFFALLMLGSLLWSLLLAVALGTLAGGGAAAGVLLATPITGLGYRYLWDRRQALLAGRAWHRQSADQREAWLAQRQALLATS